MECIVFGEDASNYIVFDFIDVAVFERATRERELFRAFVQQQDTINKDAVIKPREI
jgi:hypothetical protein